jgi:hypothetical protein
MDNMANKAELNKQEVKMRRQMVMHDFTNKESSVYSSLRDFAIKLHIPLENLEQMMTDHHERDHLVRQSLHEHTAFIKVHEGYP